MSAQPANTEILIYRTVRSQRQALRQESVAALIKRLRPLIAVIPGQEILVGALARDTTVRDFSPYCGQAAAGAHRGFPVTIGLQPVMPFHEAQTTMPNADFAFQIGQDWFIKDTASAVATSDEFGDLQALNTGYTVGK